MSSNILDCINRKYQELILHSGESEPTYLAKIGGQWVLEKISGNDNPLLYYRELLLSDLIAEIDFTNYLETQEIIAQLSLVFSKTFPELKNEIERAGDAELNAYQKALNEIKTLKDQQILEIKDYGIQNKKLLELIIDAQIEHFIANYDLYPGESKQYLPEIAQVVCSKGSEKQRERIALFFVKKDSGSLLNIGRRFWIKNERVLTQIFVEMVRHPPYWPNWLPDFFRDFPIEQFQFENEAVQLEIASKIQEEQPDVFCSDIKKFGISNENMRKELALKVFKKNPKLIVSIRDFEITDEKSRYVIACEMLAIAPIIVAQRIDCFEITNQELYSKIGLQILASMTKTDVGDWSLTDRDKYLPLLLQAVKIRGDIVCKFIPYFSFKSDEDIELLLLEAMKGKNSSKIAVEFDKLPIRNREVRERIALEWAKQSWQDVCENIEKFHLEGNDALLAQIARAGLKKESISRLCRYIAHFPIQSKELRQKIALEIADEVTQLSLSSQFYAEDFIAFIKYIREFDPEIRFQIALVLIRKYPAESASAIKQFGFNDAALRKQLLLEILQKNLKALNESIDLFEIDDPTWIKSIACFIYLRADILIRDSENRPLVDPQTQKSLEELKKGELTPENYSKALHQLFPIFIDENAIQRFVREILPKPKLIEGKEDHRDFLLNRIFLCQFLAIASLYNIDGETLEQHKTLIKELFDLRNPFIRDRLLFFLFDSAIIQKTPIPSHQVKTRLSYVMEAALQPLQQPGELLFRALYQTPGQIELMKSYEREQGLLQFLLAIETCPSLTNAEQVELIKKVLAPFTEAEAFVKRLERTKGKKEDLLALYQQRIPASVYNDVIHPKLPIDQQLARCKKYMEDKLIREFKESGSVEEKLEHYRQKLSPDLYAAIMNKKIEVSLDQQLRACQKHVKERGLAPFGKATSNKPKEEEREYYRQIIPANEYERLTQLTLTPDQKLAQCRKAMAGKLLEEFEKEIRLKPAEEQVAYYQAKINPTDFEELTKATLSPEQQVDLCKNYVIQKGLFDVLSHMRLIQRIFEFSKVEEDFAALKESRLDQLPGLFEKLFKRSLGNINVENFAEKYERVIENFRKKEVLFAYAAQHPDEPLFIAFMEDILNGTFYKNRYNHPSQTHLKMLFDPLSLREKTDAKSMAKKEELSTLKLLWEKNSTISSDEIENYAEFSNISLPKELEGEFVIQESDNYNDFFLEGEEVPLKSCQRVTNGNPSLNIGIMGHALNGYHRLVAVKNNKGEIIGRSLLHLYLDEKEQIPVLLQDTYYGIKLGNHDDRHPDVKPYVDAMCLRKAKEMNITLTSWDASDIYPNTLHAYCGRSQIEHVEAFTKVLQGPYKFPDLGAEVPIRIVWQPEKK